MNNEMALTTARAWPGAGIFGGRTRKVAAALALAVGGLFAIPTQALAAEAPTDANVAAAIAGGQQYLFNTFISDSDTVGHWPTDGYYSEAGKASGTAAAVSALIEGGKMSDPLYRAKIDKGIAYVRSMQKADGGVYSGTGTATYETGIALVALSLYGQATATDAAYRTAVQKAVDFLNGTQAREANCPNIVNTAAYYGSWNYYNTPNCNRADLSVTQFAVMGMFYGSRYLELPVANADWAVAMLKFFRNGPRTAGSTTGYGFSYSNNQYGTDMQMTAAGLWCLAMIGQTDAKYAATDTSTMVQDAVKWYSNNYPTGTGQNWNPEGAFSYTFYAMSKALTATIGNTGKVGTHDWATDMKTEALNSSYRVHTNAGEGTAATDAWTTSGNDPGTVGSTAWILMGMSFSSAAAESTEKFLAQEEKLDNPITGLLTLHTTGGVTISAAGRGRNDQAKLGKNAVLPVGAVDFTLNNVKPNGGTAKLTITPPAGAMDPTNPSSFVDKDGKLKKGLSWFKIIGGEWKGQSNIPIEVDIAKGIIVVTLTDGGPGDDDGVANGKIVDPGAPGFGADDEPEFEDGDGLFGCSIGNGRPDPTLALLLLGGVAYLVRRRRH